VTDRPTIRHTQCRKNGIGHDHRNRRSRSPEYASRLRRGSELGLTQRYCESLRGELVHPTDACMVFGAHGSGSPRRRAARTSCSLDGADRLQHVPVTRPRKTCSAPARPLGHAAGLAQSDVHADADVRQQLELHAHKRAAGAPMEATGKVAAGEMSPNRARS
jgi:hypothetical protein